MDGILIVNKEKGYTSHDVVYMAKKKLNEKVGHTGTLDPMATGVLPLLIGRGTLCSKYLINHDKEYIVKLKLGKKTDTADAEGSIIEEKEVDISTLDESIVKTALNGFIGKQEQIPPIYSAIKVNGKKLYEYARKGQSVDIKPRQIEIYDIELLQIKKTELEIDFKVKCSKGTYIRSLCEDISRKLGTIGYMKQLNRTQVGTFKLEESINISDLEKIENLNDIQNTKNFITIEEIFKNENKINLNNRKLYLFLNGVKLSDDNPDGIYKIYNDDNFIGIGVVKNNLLKRDVIVFKMN